ncbi:hypothetical protein Taro_050203 [Colocasia esculenta]|uniref:Uncharacterized protein n=1 Tax=Colocasia esculenta TaxID=4460 RepID=A0A843XD75_COLES|nr:hypothetical protein [Colocasia esculenta]
MEATASVATVSSATSEPGSRRASALPLRQGLPPAADSNRSVSLASRADSSSTGNPRRLPFVPAAMGFGGSSLSYCASRFPATIMTSSSTLSPLAPPFTVERAASRPALNYDPYVPAWPPRRQSSDDSVHHIRPPSPSPPPASPPQPTHGATTAAAVDALPYYAHGPALARASSGESSSWRNPSLALADPYYPCFSSAPATSAGDASPFYGGRREESGGGSGCLESHTIPSNVPSTVGTQAEGDYGNSAWIEREGMAVTPGYEAPFLQDPSIAPGFLAYDGLQGGWPGKFTEAPSEKDQFRYEHLDWLVAGGNVGVPSDMSGTSALAPGGPVSGRYLHSSDMQTYMEGSKRSAFNSSYPDRTDPKDFYPATTFFPDVLGSSSNTSTSIDKHSLKNVNHVQPVNACKNDMLHKQHVSIRPAEPSIDLNHRHKEVNAAMNRRKDMGMVDNANVNTSMVKITLSPSIESAKHISRDYSLAKKNELRITSFNNPGSVESAHEQHSSERLDENLAEDSPCWKGATSSRYSISRTFDTLVADHAIADRKVEGLNTRGSDYPKAENEDVALFEESFDRSLQVFSFSGVESPGWKPNQFGPLLPPRSAPPSSILFFLLGLLCRIILVSESAFDFFHRV